MPTRNPYLNKAATAATTHANPYAKLTASVANRSQAHVANILDLRHDGTGSRYVDESTGEINAGSKRELCSIIADIAARVESGSLSSDPVHPEEAAAFREEANTAFLEAYADTSTSSWVDLGASIADTVSEVADRNGFMRRIAYKAPAKQGSIIRVRVKRRNTIARIATGPSMMQRRFIRENYIMPNEFSVQANVRVDEREIAQGPGDLMEEKLFEAQEAIMVREDKYLKNLMDDATSSSLQYMAGGATPSGIASLQKNISQWGLPVQSMLIGSYVMPDILAGDAFSRYFGPLPNYQLVLTGKIGTLFGMQVITDSFRIPEQRVVLPNEIYVLSNPENMAFYTDRGPLNSKEANDAATVGIPMRGWFFWELLSMVLFNDRAVAKAERTD